MEILLTNKIEEIKMYNDVLKKECDQCHRRFRVMTIKFSTCEVSLCVECRRSIVHLVIDEDNSVEKKNKKLNLIF